MLVAGADAAGQRLDQWLAASLGPDMSRSRVQMLIRQGAVSINGKPVDETKRKMSAGENADFVQMTDQDGFGRPSSSPWRIVT